MKRKLLDSLVFVMVMVTLLMGVAAPAQAHDIPNQILMPAFIKPEGNQIRLLVRIPLIMLANLSLPKRGPGYLDLDRIQPELDHALSVTAGEISIYENGARLEPSQMQARISTAADTAFDTYTSALAHFAEPELTPDTNVFWNQGFFDVSLVYPIRSPDSSFALDTRVAPGLSGRIKWMVRFLAPQGDVRSYVLHGDFGRVILDPKWYQAGWLFVKTGFSRLFGGAFHLLFLIALALPFLVKPGSLRPLLLAAVAFTLAHSLSFLWAAFRLSPDGEWFTSLVAILMAASVLYLALENFVVLNPRRRWIAAGLFGLAHGVGFAGGLEHIYQFTGRHLLLSFLAFNLGIEIAQVVALLLILALMSLALRLVPNQQRLGIFLVSAFLAHTAWHALLERQDEFRLSVLPGLATVPLAVWGRGLLVLLLVGGLLRILSSQPRPAVLERIFARGRSTIQGTD